MYYVYILKDRTQNKLYIGYTTDLQRRIKEHTRRQVHTTKRYKEKDLVFYEVFFDKQDALRREKYFKSTKGKRALKLMLKGTLRDFI